jgi:hypothetical protein
MLLGRRQTNLPMRLQLEAAFIRASFGGRRFGRPEAAGVFGAQRVSGPINDEPSTRAIVAALEKSFRLRPRPGAAPASSASKDFSVFCRALGAPSLCWFVGGTDASVFAAAEKVGTVDDLPSNHAPISHP